MAESGCKCKSLSIHRPDTSGYLMYHTSNLCIIHQILCIGTISSDTSCIIHQILDVYLHLHPDERLAPNFAIHILYSDTAYTAIHGDTAYRMYHPPSESEIARGSRGISYQKVDVSYHVYYSVYSYVFLMYSLNTTVFQEYSLYSRYIPMYVR